MYIQLVITELVLCSQTFRLTAEGFGIMAALKGQGPPKSTYD